MDRYSKKDGTKEERPPLSDSDKNANNLFFARNLKNTKRKKMIGKKMRESMMSAITFTSVVIDHLNCI